MSHTDERHIDFRLTKHARKVISERGISCVWIKRVLAFPLAVELDREDAALLHAIGHITERDDRILRVVYNKTVKPWSVVTAFFDRKASRQL